MKTLWFIGCLFFQFQSIAQFHSIEKTSSSSVIYGSQADLNYEAAKDTSGKSPEQIHKENLSHIQNFIDISVDEINHKAVIRDKAYAKYISPEQASDVLRAAQVNPVVSLSKYSKYDPKNEGIGYCFGRCMFTHLELTQRQFDRDSIKKAFAIGPMKTPDGGMWGWHVTTIAQSLDAKGNEVWLAIDPIYTRNKDGQMPTLEEWYKEMRDKYSTDGKLKLYVTSSGKFGPSSKYNEGVKTLEFYHGYFEDMMKWFREKSKAGEYLGKQISSYKAAMCARLF